MFYILGGSYFLEDLTINLKTLIIKIKTENYGINK
jgi:hypothetical protein